MGLLQKIFRKDSEEEEVDIPQECTHASFVARWDSPDDIGKEDLATSWQCTSCSENFTPQQKREFEAAELERVRHFQEEKEALARREAEEAEKHPT